MVALDALEYPPSLFAVLTTRDPFMPSSDVRLHLRHVARVVRESWPEFQYACFVEFTTGLSVWSGGHRRIHLNLLIKGVPATDAERLRECLLATWGHRTRTHHLHVGGIYAAEGLVRYLTNLALHVMKEGQKPPADYPGHLIRSSRGYFAGGATTMRAKARRSLRIKRLVHAGMDAETAELETAVRELDEWHLLAFNPSLVDVRAIRESR